MAITSVPNHFKVIKHRMRWMLYTLFGLMVADGLLTEFFVINGYRVEANPLMQFWVSQELFLTLKVSGVFLVTLFLWIRATKSPLLKPISPPIQYIFAKTEVVPEIGTGN
ncbi:DUF5658 family protein [Chloroflexota bacterium]